MKDACWSKQETGINKRVQRQEGINNREAITWALNWTIVSRKKAVSGNCN